MGTLCLHVPASHSTACIPRRATLSWINHLVDWLQLQTINSVASHLLQSSILPHLAAFGDVRHAAGGPSVESKSRNVGLWAVLTAAHRLNA